MIAAFSVIVSLRGSAGVSENKSLTPKNRLEISLPEKWPPDLAWQKMNFRFQILVCRGEILHFS